MKYPVALTAAVALTGGVLVLSVAETASASSNEAAALPYQHQYQYHVGGWSQFNVIGPATGDNPDVQGDAIIRSVDFPNGESSQFFYKPVEVSDLTYTGQLHRFSVRGGDRVTNGVVGTHVFGTADGNGNDASDYDIDVFQDLMLEAFSNNNLNNYVDLSGSSPRFEFTIKFDKKVRDDDPGPDDFGEILYFERGAGSGNSWLRMQAVDANGNALGPWLVVGPSETVQTTPVTAVYRNNQKMGTTSIDVSRLGVSEFQYLRVSNSVTDEPAYVGGGDLAPDFKIMAVITDRKAMLAEHMNLYD